MTILNHRLEDILKKRRNRDAGRHGDHPHADRKRDFAAEKKRRETKRKEEEEAKKQKLSGFQLSFEKTPEQKKTETRSEKRRSIKWETEQAKHDVDPKLPEEQQQKTRDENTARLRKLEADAKEANRFSINNFRTWLDSKRTDEKGNVVPKKRGRRRGTLGGLGSAEGQKETKESIDTDETLSNLDDAFGDAIGDDKKDDDANKSWESWLETRKDALDPKAMPYKFGHYKIEGGRDKKGKLKPLRTASHFMPPFGRGQKYESTDSLSGGQSHGEQGTNARTGYDYTHGQGKKGDKKRGFGQGGKNSIHTGDYSMLVSNDAKERLPKDPEKFRSGYQPLATQSKKPRHVHAQEYHHYPVDDPVKRGRGGLDSSGGEDQPQETKRVEYERKLPPKNPTPKTGKAPKIKSWEKWLVKRQGEKIGEEKRVPKYSGRTGEKLVTGNNPNYTPLQYRQPLHHPDHMQPNRKIDRGEKKMPKYHGGTGEKMSEGNQGNLSKAWEKWLEARKSPWVTVPFVGPTIGLGWVDDPVEDTPKKRREKRQRERAEEWEKEREAKRKKEERDNIDTEEAKKDYTADDIYRERREAKRDRYNRQREGDFSGDPDKMTPSPEQIENRRRKEEKEAVRDAYKKAKKLRKKTEKKEVKLTEGGKKVLDEAKRYASLNMYKSWLEARKAIKGACPWCKDQPKETQDLTDDTVGRMLDNASQKGPEHLSNYVRSLAEYQLEHDKNPEHFHKKWLESWDRAGEKRHPGKKINDTDPKQDETLKAKDDYDEIEDWDGGVDVTDATTPEELIEALNRARPWHKKKLKLPPKNSISEENKEKLKDVSGAMGGTRGLGHDGGSKQSPGSSTQITEVVDEPLKRGEALNAQVAQELKPIVNRMENVSTKAAYENHEQDEGTDVKPNSQQINPARPKVDTFKSKHLYKKALVVKYNNIYKPLNI